MKLVIAVGGGPLSFYYGTPDASPEVFVNEIKKVFEESNAKAIEMICVDPNTACGYELDQKEKGFSDPDYKGKGWNAKVFDYDFEGKFIASFHEYCGSYCTNLNGGIWKKDIDPEYIKKAISSIRKSFPGLDIAVRVYHKRQKKGKVDKRLKRLTKVLKFI